jgi:hypothetical protein
VQGRGGASPPEAQPHLKNEIRGSLRKGRALPRSGAAEPLATPSGKREGKSRSAFLAPSYVPRRGQCAGRSATRSSSPPRWSPDTPTYRSSAVLCDPVKAFVASLEEEPRKKTRVRHFRLLESDGLRRGPEIGPTSATFSLGRGEEHCQNAFSAPSLVPRHSRVSFIGGSG